MVIVVDGYCCYHFRKEAYKPHYSNSIAVYAGISDYIAVIPESGTTAAKEVMRYAKVQHD